MRYDPFARGPFPVGVDTVSLRDPAAGRALSVELWYPAVSSSSGLDLHRGSQDEYRAAPSVPPRRQAAVRAAVPRLGSFPLLLFSHDFGGHRRQSTFLCTHVASHGYVVAAPDHSGDTVADLGPGARAAWSKALEARSAHLVTVVEQLMERRGGAGAAHLDRERVAVCGHGLGGWSAFAATGEAPSIAVAVGLAPAGGNSDAMVDAIDFDWDRLVPTLVLAGGRDSLVPVDVVRALCDRIRAPKKLLVLDRADHAHFRDDARRAHERTSSLPLAGTPMEPRRPLPPIEELVTPEAAHEVVRAVALAHLDAHLRALDEAKDFLAEESTDRFTDRGVTAAWE